MENFRLKRKGIHCFLRSTMKLLGFRPKTHKDHNPCQKIDIYINRVFVDQFPINFKPKIKKYHIS